MTKFCKFWILLILEWQLQTFVTGSLHIFPKNDWPIVKMDETWSVTCEGDAPVTWTSENIQSKIRLDYQNSSESGNYSSTLTIRNVDEQDAGFQYNCRYQDPNKTDGILVRLQVDDDQILFVWQRNFTILIHAKKNMAAILPCLPTSRFVDVKLFPPSDPDTLKNDTRISYDMAKGFTINPVRIGDEGLHYCEGTRGDVKETLVVALIVTEELRETPRINHSLAESVRVGDNFTLNCTVYFAHVVGQTYWHSLKWTWPESVNSSRVIVSREVDTSPNDKTKSTSSNLTVNNSTKEDAGEYVCTLSSFNFSANASYNVKIYDPLEQFLNVTTVQTSIIETAGQTARWVIRLHSVPAVKKIDWFDKTGQKATRNRRFNINDTNSKEIVLSITNVTLEDDGGYELRVTNSELNSSLLLNLTVKGEPSVAITAEPGSGNVYGNLFRVNTNVTFICKAKGYPYPDIIWELDKCPQDNGEEDADSCTTKKLGRGRQETFSDSGRGTLSYLTVELTSNGYAHCLARNNLSSDTSDKEIKVIDFESPSTTGFDLLGDSEPIEHSDIVLTCAARKLNFKNDIKWFKENNGLWEPLNVTEFTETPWSHKSYVKIKNINSRHSGNYSCTVSNLSGQDMQRRRQTVNVQKIIPPHFTDLTNLENNTVRYGRGDSIPELVCEATGIPKPTVTWFLDDVPETMWQFDSLKSSMVGGMSFLKVPSKAEYQGRYTCKASNGFTSIVYKEIKIEGDHWLIVAAGLGFVVVVLILCLVFKVYKDRKAQLKLIKLLQDELEKGAPGDINPDLPVHEQVNLLPYYDCYEIPRYKIVLGMLLGQGAFGKVLKAEVLGVVPGAGSTIAAVKMVKANSNQSHLDALAKELKILVHLGKHVNVVNLVGACTKNYAKKKELLVVVEYCRYGNLLKYLHRHRKDFKNQLNSSTGKIDHAYYSRFPSQSPTQKLNYAALTFAHSQSARPDSSRYLKLEQVPHMPDITTPVSLNPSSNNYLTGSNGRSMNTEMSFVSDDPAGTDGRRMSTDSACMSYRGDYQNQEVGHITTTSLVCWAFQIANGMDYLARRNVVHGDLAARNVLLADNDVVKICDFGLAREMYRDFYQKQKDKTDLLPVKWMAIESIRDFKFNTKSDVWSYGVVLWELFTLGNSPYPGMEPDAEFYNLLYGGFRMNKPEFASSEIYELMNKCWNIIPEDRPTFASIADDLGDMCDQSLREHYIALNEDCNRENSRMLEGREDYLLQMPVSDITVRGSTPDDRAYVNVATEIPNNDYLRPLPVNRPDYVTVQPDPSHDNFVNNFAYHSVNPNTLDSPNSVNIFSPRSGESDQRFDFCGVELTDLSKCKDNPTVDKNILSSEPNNDQEQRNPEAEGFSNSSYVSLPDRPNNPNTFSDSVEFYAFKNIKNDLVKTGISKRKKNDSGVSSSSSGQASDSESPRSSLKESHSVPNGYGGSKIQDIIVQNQNYFRSQSIMPNGDL
ncbi:unnamed protein product [Allacma fusca]|uniref:Vascular endothelial growth factor receptor 1 n=1 Tax=Allacma fusca TaxID=39272 RepID=A0A8J2NWT1_9HEXA|nr:unnamed protein product [Allacma fusca]